MNVNKYYNGQIYKIICNISKKMYIGSTSYNISLYVVLKNHKENYKSFLKGNKCYITSIEILKNKNYFIYYIIFQQEYMKSKCLLNCTFFYYT